MVRLKIFVKGLLVAIVIPIVIILGFLICREFVSAFVIKATAILLTLILAYSLYRPLPKLGLKNRFTSLFVIVVTLPLVFALSFIPVIKTSYQYNYRAVAAKKESLTEEQIAVNVAKAKERAEAIANSNIDYNSFYLPRKYEKFMPVLKQGAPIVKQQAGCDKIDYADISTSKGTSSNPVFFYTCTKFGIPSNIFISKSDIENNQINIPKPIEVSVARERCMTFAKSRLNFPSTFDTGIFQWATQDWPNGRRRVVIEFTAKNAFGLELPASVKCLFIPNPTGSYELEGTISDR